MPVVPIEQDGIGRLGRTPDSPSPMFFARDYAAYQPPAPIDPMEDFLAQQRLLQQAAARANSLAAYQQARQQQTLANLAGGLFGQAPEMGGMNGIDTGPLRPMETETVWRNGVPVVRNRGVDLGLNPPSGEPWTPTGSTPVEDYLNRTQYRPTDPGDLNYAKPTTPTTAETVDAFGGTPGEADAPDDWKAKALKYESEFDSHYLDAQRLIYGTEESMEPDPLNPGRLVPQFSTDQAKFIGIESGEQRLGYLPVEPINRPGKNATQDEWKSYYERLTSRIKMPTYTNGSETEIWRNMDRSQTIKIQKMFRAAGKYPLTQGITPGLPGFIEKSIMYDLMGRANQAGVTWDVILQSDLMNKRKLEAKRRAAAGGGGSGASNTVVNIQYTKTSVDQGRQLLSQVLQNAIGRAPTTQQLNEFIKRLNSAEAQSPVRTVTNYVRDGSTTTSTSRTNPSDVDPEAIAQEFAAEQEGFGEYQTNQYTDMLSQMLMGASRA